MIKKSFTYLVLFVFSLTGISYAEEEKSMLPYRGGSTFYCTQGTFEDPDNHWDAKNQKYIDEETNPTHNKYVLEGSMKYAVDFGVPLDTPLVAVIIGAGARIATFDLILFLMLKYPV